MDIGLLYTITAFVCFLMIVLIYNRVVATTYKETVDRHFCTLLYFFMGFCIVDGIWGVFLSATAVKTLLGPVLYRIGNITFTYGFHTLAAISAFMWSSYMINFIGAKKNTKQLLTYVRSVILIGQMTLLYSNIWTGAAFSFDENGTYVTGIKSMRTVMFLVQFTYYVVLIVSTLCFLIYNRKKSRETRAYRSAVVISFIPLIFGIGQLAWPDAAMYSFGFMFSAFSIYSFTVTSQREYFMEELANTRDRKHITIIESLSSNYDSIFYIDASTGRYEVFDNFVTEEGQTLKHLEYGEHFFDAPVKNMKLHVLEEDRPLVEEKLNPQNLNKELSEKSEFSFRYRLVVGDSVEYYMTRCFRSNTKGEETKYVIGVSNIDEEQQEEMRRQEALNQAKIQAEAANNAKSTFLFSMSHDIRTPMNAIIGFTDMAKKHFDDKDRVRDCLDKISASGDHLLNLINDVLDMARIEAGKVEIDEVPINIAEASQATMAIAVETGNKKGVTVTLHKGPLGKCSIYADPLRLNQVALNILSNAIKYTEPGGKVDVWLDEIDDAEPGKLHCQLIVADTGIGMSEEFVAKIFEPFERARTSTVSGIQGTGLGMSIVRSLVEMMNGKVRVESKIGVGTRVTVDFVFRLADDVKKEDLAADTGAENLSGKKVLLVEDNELNREIARDILEELGMTVEEADDGTVAVKRCAEKIPLGPDAYPDFILMDVQMPVMDGYTATSEIRSLNDPYDRHIPIIAMTANAFAEDKQRALESGMDAHLSKPINIEELITTLTSLLPKKQ